MPMDERRTACSAVGNRWRDEDELYAAMTIRSAPARPFLLCALLLLAGCTREMRGTIPGDPALGFVEVGAGSPTLVVLHGGPAATHSYLRPEWDRLAKGRRVLY